MTFFDQLKPSGTAKPDTVMSAVQKKAVARLICEDFKRSCLAAKKYLNTRCEQTYYWYPTGGDFAIGSTTSLNIQDKWKLIDFSACTKNNVIGQDGIERLTAELLYADGFPIGTCTYTMTGPPEKPYVVIALRAHW